MRQQRRPDVVIVGAGLMGRWHAATARRLGAHVVAVVDTDAHRGQRLARSTGARHFKDIDAVLSQTRADFAHICTPVQTHVPFAQRFLAAGSHVICEKPLAADAAAVAGLLEFARLADRGVWTVHQFAHQSCVARIDADLSQLGELRRIDFLICSAGAEGLPAAQQDAVLLDVLPHPLSVLKRLLPQLQLAALPWQLQHPGPGELLAQTSYDGTAIRCVVSLSARPTAAIALLAGTRGSAQLNFFHGYVMRTPGTVSRSRKILAPFMTAVTELGAAGGNLLARAWRGEPAYPGLRTLIAAAYASPMSARQADAQVLDIYATIDVLAHSLRTA